MKEKESFFQFDIGLVGCGLNAIETHSKWDSSLNASNLGPNTTNSLNAGNLTSEAAVLQLVSKGKYEYF